MTQPIKLIFQRALQISFFVFVAKPLLTLFFGVRVLGRENLQPNDPFVVVANHSSHLDALALLSIFPLSKLNRIRPVAAGDYFLRNKFIAWFALNLFNIIPIVRTGITRANNPLPKMLESLQAGQSLIIFPEGTRRSEEKQLGKFLPGISHLVKHAPGLTIIPIYLTNLGRCLPKGEWIPIPFFCEMRIGSPIKPAGTKGEVTTAIQQAIADLSPMDL